jgi:hypothetical protein
MTDHRLIIPTKNNVRYYLYHKWVIENHKYNIKFFYSDATAMLFTLWFLQDVVKERVRGDDLVSKLSEKWAMKAWLGLQDTWCREMTKTLWCDRRVHE